jgi:hypothetical protein
MKAGIGLLVLTLALLGGVGYWVVSQNAVRPFTPDQSEAEAVQPPPPTHKPDVKPAVKKSLAKAPVEPVSVEPATPAQPPVEQTVAAKAAAPSATPATASAEFPSPDEIRQGEPATMVIGKFGGPTVTATTRRKGHLLETYVYSRDRGKTNTVIHLGDGKVVSTYSMDDGVRILQ